jgi:hypothetical protein
MFNDRSAATDHEQAGTAIGRTLRSRLPSAGLIIWHVKRRAPSLVVAALIITAGFQLTPPPTADTAPATPTTTAPPPATVPPPDWVTAAIPRCPLTPQPADTDMSAAWWASINDCGRTGAVLRAAIAHTNLTVAGADCVARRLTGYTPELTSTPWADLGTELVDALQLCGETPRTNNRAVTRCLTALTSRQVASAVRAGPVDPSNTALTAFCPDL